MSRQLRSAAFALAFAIGAKAALPVPPSQHVPWQPQPAIGIPDYVPEAVAALFDAGLADPRGGEYRRVEVSRPSASGGTVTLNGWSFPGGFAVGWDGLVHRVVRAGERVDLSADVAAAKAKFWREGLWTPRPDAEFVGVALLLRLGEQDLARQMLAQMPALPRQRRDVSGSEERRLARLDWFQIAGAAWLSGVYHQAVEAHAVGNDRLTTDIGEMLIGARESFEAARNALGPPGIAGVQSPAAFLDPVPVLIADSNRRLSEPPRPPLDRIDLRGMTQPARIAALIDRLEDVSERQFSQPGGVWIMGSPICQMLASEGAAAIDSLLEVLDHDQRLTRSYSFGRNFFPERHTISVAEAAKALLEEYYGVRLFRWNDATELRAWLIRNKFRSQAERAFDLLAGDKNEELQWLDGAQMLLSTNKNGPGLLGDVLRERKNPSVSELLAKRVTQSNTNWGNNLSLLLFQWDPPASLGALRHQATVWRSYHGDLYSSIVAALLQLGDSSSLEDWVTGIKTDHRIELQQLVPLWTAPEHETVAGVARKLFLDPNAPMSPAAMLAAGSCPDNLIQSPLLISPAFRDSVFKGLARGEVIGTVVRVAGGNAKVTAPCGASIGCPVCGRSNPPAHQPGTQQIRIADSIAYRLSMICGFPEFDLEAPPQQRDQAIAATAEFLRTHVADLRAPALTANMPLWELKVSLAIK